MMHSTDQRGENGAVLVFVALAMTVLLGVVALVVDLGNGRQTRQQAQAAVDATALAGAQDYLPTTIGTTLPAIAWSTVVSDVQTYMQVNYGIPTSAWTMCTDPSALTYRPDTSNTDTCISADNSSDPTLLRINLPPHTVSTYFGRTTGLNSISIGAAAEAKVSRVSVCAFCSLSQSSTGALGNGVLTTTGSADGAVWINGSLQCGGNGTITSSSIEIQNGTSNNCPAGMTTNAGPVPDPLAGLPIAPDQASAVQPGGSESFTGLSAQSDCSSGTAGPGIYHNISDCVLTPGLYVVTGTMGGNNTTISGLGVTVFFTCGTTSNPTACSSNGQNGGRLSVSGNSSSNFLLNACTTGTCLNNAVPGMAVWYDRNNTQDVTLDGSGTLSVAGTIYAPSSTLTLNGSGTGTAGACTTANLCSTVVVGSFKFDGNNQVSVDYQPANSLALGLPQLYQ